MKRSVTHYRNFNRPYLIIAIILGLWVSSSKAGGYDAPYFQADFIQDLSNWASPLVNPALLYRVNQMHLEVGGYYWALGPEAIGYQQAGFLAPVRRNHTFGLTLLYAGQSLVGTDVDNKNIGVTSFKDMWAIGSYSIRILPWLMAGSNLKYRIQDQFGDWSGAKFPGLDVGLYLNPIDHYRFGDVGFSVSLQDIFPTQIDWEGANMSEVTVNRARAGLRYAGWNDNLVMNAEVLIDNALVDVLKNFDTYRNMYQAVSEEDPDKWVGTLPKELRYGAHAKFMFIPQIWLKTGWTNNNIPYVGFNYNFIYLFPEWINYFQVDYHVGYSFIERSGGRADARGITMMGKVATDIGPTREQKESERLYSELTIAPNDAYLEAMRLYSAGKYWEASFAFGKVLALYPGFHLNDKATWYLGNTYRHLRMNDIAREVYQNALEEFTTSEMRAYYLYGLESLDYREGKYDDALKNHAFITNLYAESDIRPEADYLAGQIHFERKNYNVAEQLLGNIQAGDTTFLYAQYTLSIINIENSKPEAAIQNLKAVIDDTSANTSAHILQDAANTKLGHLYFEQGDKLRLAVEAYQRVPDGSTYGDEALLGTAWAWIKVNQPKVAYQAIERLIANHSESPLIPEAYLVKGYSLMLLKQYQEANDVLEQCLEECNKEYITKSDLHAREARFDQYTRDFEPTSEEILKNALRKPTTRTLNERTELEQEYRKFSKESRTFFNFTLRAKSHSRFFKRKDQIIADAEYALAKASNMMGLKPGEEKGVKEKEEKIEKELEKLKKELEEFEE